MVREDGEHGAGSHWKQRPRNRPPRLHWEIQLGLLRVRFYETSNNRCQMKKLDIQISNSEKDFVLEINIWGVSAYNWSVCIFVCTFI